MSGRNTLGTALLAFSTQRQPDVERGTRIKHFELTLDQAIEDEIQKWETGNRLELNPREVAAMLWSTKTASHLDGAIDSWMSVPGVRLLLPGWQALTGQPPSSWPSTRDELRELVAEAHDTSMGTANFIRRLEGLDGNTSAADLLNDLVLIFKYAAIGYRRPIHLAADLYRLARTLLADTDVAPSDAHEVFNWLTAPLVVPRALTAPQGPAGPRPPGEPGIGGISANSSAPFVLNLDSPRIIAAVNQLENDLAVIDQNEVDAAIRRALRNAGVVDEEAVAQAIEGNRSGGHPDLFSARMSIMRRATGSPKQRSTISRTIGGFHVRVDMAEAMGHAQRDRKEQTSKFLSALPESLRNRIAERANEYVLELPNDVLDEISSHPTGPPTPSYLEPVGRTDLLLVRQVTTGYRRAEIAHVENVLIGEQRERDHTKRVLTRDESFESLETESEETTDLQTTDSSDLSSEVGKVVAEALSVEGSVNVTYRGATEVAARVAGSFETSTENAAKAATEYATEIVDRAVKRLVERTKSESRSLFEQEIVEENRHHFAGKETDDHVTGVYQYLERVSRAKIFNYGERDLYDIMVPEPAALIWNLAIPRADDADYLLDEPDHDLFNSLTLANIESKMEELIRAFKVVNFPPVPDEAKTIVVPFSHSQVDNDSDNNVYVTHATKRIDAGYVVAGADCTVFAEQEGNDNKPLGSFTIGLKTEQWALAPQNSGRRNLHFAFSPPMAGPEVGIAINVENHVSTTGNIVIHLALTDDKRRGWQLEAYSRVAERYEQMRRDAQLALIREQATQTSAGDDLPVGARRRLKKLVRDELQRAVIGIMRNAPVDFDLINEVPLKGPPYPTTDLDALNSNEVVIRFLQQAFEWEHLSWILYPYFWGRRDGQPGWGRTIVQDHPDPDFAAFLNAGAARLQVSVRPGFENLVKHFMETGEAYEGGGLPQMGDAGYVPFIDEQVNSLGAPGDEIAWPVSQPIEWEVVSPTPLTLVRKVGEERLPRWEPETGEEIVS